MTSELRFGDPIRIESKGLSGYSISGSADYEDWNEKILKVNVAQDSGALEEWEFVSVADKASTEKVKFGDEVALKSCLLSFDNYYLSARSETSIGLSRHLLGWEKWTITNPAAPDSKQSVRAGDSFVLMSKRFERHYLDVSTVAETQAKRVGIKQVSGEPRTTVPTLSDNEKWTTRSISMVFEPKAGEDYMLLIRHSGKCAEFADVQQATGAKFQQWTPVVGSDEAQFKLEPKGDGYFYIIQRKHGIPLGVNTRAKEIGAPVWLWAIVSSPGPVADSDANRRFKFEPQEKDGKTYYRITPKHSGKCVDIQGHPPWDRDGLVLHQWEFFGNDNQLFELTPTGDGYFYISSKASKKVIHAKMERLEVAQRGAKYPRENQLFGFEPEPKAPGYFRIVCRHSGKYVEAVGTDFSQPICQMTKIDSDNQLFRFEPDHASRCYYRITPKHMGGSKCLDVRRLSNENGARIYLWDVVEGGQNQLFWPVSRGIVAAQQYIMDIYSSAEKLKEARTLFEKGAAEVVQHARRERLLVFSEEELRFVLEAARSTGAVFQHYAQNSLQQPQNQSPPEIRYPAGGIPFLPAGPGGVPTQAMIAAGLGPATTGMRLGLMAAALGLMAAGNTPENTKKAVVYLMAAVVGGPENPLLRDKIMEGQPTGNPVVDGVIAGTTLFVFGLVDSLRKISEAIQNVIPRLVPPIFR